MDRVFPSRLVRHTSWTSELWPWLQGPAAKTIRWRSTEEGSLPWVHACVHTFLHVITTRMEESTFTPVCSCVYCEVSIMGHVTVSKTPDLWVCSYFFFLLQKCLCFEIILFPILFLKQFNYFHLKKQSLFFILKPFSVTVFCDANPSLACTSSMVLFSPLFTVWTVGETQKWSERFEKVF